MANFITTSWREESNVYQLPNHIACYVGKAVVAACVTVGQFFVMDTHQMKNSGMQVVNVNFVFHGLESEIIRGAVGLSTFGATPCHEHAKPPRVVIPAVFVFGSWCSPEFPAPENQGVFQ